MIRMRYRPSIIDDRTATGTLPARTAESNGSRLEKLQSKTISPEPPMTTGSRSASRKSSDRARKTTSRGGTRKTTSGRGARKTTSSRRARKTTSNRGARKTTSSKGGRKTTSSGGARKTTSRSGAKRTTSNGGARRTTSKEQVLADINNEPGPIMKRFYPMSIFDKRTRNVRIIT